MAPIPSLPPKACMEHPLTCIIGTRRASRWVRDARRTGEDRESYAWNGCDMS
ncbi:hypothetical protein HMPREF1316_0491 [Olsenella profusa F0195]|uniref:Uncharacterized protein n=1 Tax=Olsenella profusa F0195 TaxID=1125712 RepID=U2TK20_9ACTN|nr:hypothetical protein HMPREF1316_0491 [Olsenella profusa F0195]